MAWDKKERRAEVQRQRLVPSFRRHVIRRLAGVHASRMDQNIGRAKWGRNARHQIIKAARGPPHRPQRLQR